MEHVRTTPASPKSKLRQTLCNYCCFRLHGHEIVPSPTSSSDDDSPRLFRSSSTWLKSRTQELPEFKYKCRYLINRIVGHNRGHSSPADFRYDPLSYALNFDEGTGDSFVNETPLRNFSSSRSPALETVAEEDGRVNQSLPRAISCA